MYIKREFSKPLGKTLVIFNRAIWPSKQKRSGMREPEDYNRQTVEGKKGKTDRERERESERFVFFS